MSSQNHSLSQKSTKNVPLILVVDDNEDNLLYACGSLDLLELQHIVAKNPQAAIDIAMDKQPDAILLDIVMPGMDGIEVMQTLKRHHLTNHIPIIAVTGLALPSQQEEIFKGGCDDYLCKPYLIEELEEKLTLYLDFDLVNSSTGNDRSAT